MPSLPALELWGGVECTVNRVGDAYFDQIARSGHDGRDGDADRIASLGIGAVRYPVLWERCDRGDDAPPDFERAAHHLERFRALGVRAIVGLVHHGSGPRRTSLLDPAWPARLARFARQAAERFPWVEDWTPVNEPLTTARFAALYGIWYPHARDDRSFVAAMLNQIEGVRLAMAAIRSVIPGARLVQTEDLAKTHATQRLASQARFENDRRWLTIDLLAGSVDDRHPLWCYLVESGADAGRLRAMCERPCRPDVQGANHYLTSERFLDERVEHYAPSVVGGNRWARYADVEAVRVHADGADGLTSLLLEAWDRHRIPLAVTEAHLGCTREQQLRWLAGVWRSARDARDAGADVRAVTLWSLFGAYDWATLLTRDDGMYEPGAFDLRAPLPRPTALAVMARALASSGSAPHPAAAGPGWWERPDRLAYPPATSVAGPRHPEAPAPRTSARRDAPVLVTGAAGTLGRELTRACESRGLAVVALGRHELDAAHPASIEAALDRHRPWAIVNAAGYVRVDDAEDDEARCMRENRDAAAELAAAAAKRGIRLATMSSDLVFGGEAREPYVESTAVRPLGVYGRSKVEAEALVLALAPSALVARTSAFFGPRDDWNFAHHVLVTLARGERVAMADDETVTPTYVPDLAHALLDLLIDGERGIWHLSSGGAATWADLARRVAERAGVDASLVAGAPGASLGHRARRPAFSALGSERGWPMPAFDDALGRYMSARGHEVVALAAAQAPAAR